uniref:NADH:ubiquinone reductase (H(+)-translocating) n=1 Tax=Acanthoparyphium sp. WAK-2018 TaxID=2185117 RepID=A0A2S1YEJ4_9TREM|nr:NADH dehydrogenase subunit 5 [Acanthoparyphium sp. WAK-2018]
MLLSVYFFFGLLVLWIQSFVGVVGSLSWLSYGLLGDTLLSVMFDEVSSVGLFMLFCCGSIALYYCHHYFGGSLEGVLLFPLIVWFLGVMGILMVSSSLLFSLFFWEYLGIVSFFLILFYSNMSSLRASLITLFASRFGDVSIFLLIMCVSCWCQVSSVLYVVLFLLVVLTKSACYPFVSWLLEAMRAPTPVSSLVHSSTLVAAGVWFTFRYSYLGDLLVWDILVWFSIVTVFITAVSAVFFMDLKKIVALSTCNNVSWCLLFYISGDLELALLQLLTHGVCKCYLFMSVGDLMSQSGSSQSAVGVYISRYSGCYLLLVQGFLVFSLCGLPFLGVFFSKHGLFAGVLYGGNVGLWWMYVIGLFLSYVYSVRFCLLLSCSGGGLSNGYSSFFLLVCPLVFLGTGLNYFWSVWSSECCSLSFFWSLGILVVQVGGCLLGGFLYYSVMGGGSWFSLLCGVEGYVSAVYSMFLWVSSVCILSFYRWEVYLLSGWSLFIRSLVVFRTSAFSLNVVVLGLLFLLWFSFVV